MDDVEKHDDPRACSRDPCKSRLPPGTEVPEGWTIVRCEKYKLNTVEVYYLYVCSMCSLLVVENQGKLFENEVST